MFTVTECSDTVIHAFVSIFRKEQKDYRKVFYDTEPSTNCINEAERKVIDSLRLMAYDIIGGVNALIFLKGLNMTVLAKALEQEMRPVYTSQTVGAYQHKGPELFDCRACMILQTAEAISKGVAAAWRISELWLTEKMEFVKVTGFSTCTEINGKTCMSVYRNTKELVSDDELSEYDKYELLDAFNTLCWLVHEEPKTESEPPRHNEGRGFFNAQKQNEG